ncbi:dephospho-CoA kinase [Tessaracoccus caeni]|uniref:dephospho-CoA kinase n=1 Tax=Tessaracoccus caeni TaxID=3031239 RepID=UPI0023DA49E7|nr:dephospho-CoA kinase [Tessaracoccus caeni]MDF1487889.1 dephospho-CoA kinase [Tessaracoccus caeni]
MRIGVTGGIASGKTLVSDALARLGAVVIDADLIAREVVEPGTAGLAEIVERFGPEILGDDGALDRAALGEIVFADDAARADLNAIVHPRVRARASALEASAPTGAVVAHIIPLLVETGQQDAYDGVLVVDAPDDVRERRLMQRNALTREQARARIAAQATRDERLAAATWVIDNSGAPEGAVAQVEAWWAEVVGPVS